MAKKSKIERKAEKLAKVEKSKAAGTKPTTTETVEVPVVENEEKPVEQPTDTQKQETKSQETTQSTTEEKPPVEASKPKKAEKKKKTNVDDVIEAEEVAPIVSKPNTITEGLTAIANGERIDRNHGIDLMGMIHKQYVSNPDAPKELRDSMSSQFDAMAFIHLYHWNEQTKNDFKEAGIKVNPQMFDAMSNAVANALGLQLKGLPSKEDPQQMSIDFDATMKGASEETKEVIAAEKRTKPITKLPEYDPEMTEEAVIANLRSIMSMHNGMQNNLYNAIEFAKKAFKMESSQPAEVLATIMTKLETPHVLMNSFRGMAYGSLQKSENPFIPHARFMEKLKPFNYTDKQVADIVRLFLVDAMQSNAKGDAKSLASTETAFEKLFTVFDDAMITKICENIKDEKKTVTMPKISGLLMSGNPLNSSGIASELKKAYGDMVNDQLRKQLKTISALYNKPLGTVTDYTKLQ